MEVYQGTIAFSSKLGNQYKLDNNKSRTATGTHPHRRFACSKYSYWRLDPVLKGTFPGLMSRFNRCLRFNN